MALLQVHPFIALSMHSSQDLIKWSKTCARTWPIYCQQIYFLTISKSCISQKGVRSRKVKTLELSTSISWLKQPKTCTRLEIAQQFPQDKAEILIDISLLVCPLSGLWALCRWVILAKLCLWVCLCTFQQCLYRKQEEFKRRPQIHALTWILGIDWCKWLLCFRLCL